MTGSAPRKTRAMMYEQQLCHLPASVDEMYRRIEALAPKRYAGIVHDRDITDAGRPAADHLHVMMEFANPRSVRSVAKSLGDKAERLEAWKAGTENGFSYLCHRTDGARSKYQYGPSLVRANFDYPAALASIESRVSKARSHSNIKILLDDLLEGRIDREGLISQLSGSEYARAKRQIEDVYARRLQVSAAEWRAKMRDEGRRVQAIWIFGPAGTGKSSLAKQYAQSKGEPFFVSGSTRDVFQGYAGQHTIILDELRPSSIPYADLLRVTDPYAIEHEVMAPARYADKAIAADLIIVTTPYNPMEFYCEQVKGPRSGGPTTISTASGSSKDGFPSSWRCSRRRYASRSSGSSLGRIGPPMDHPGRTPIRVSRGGCLARVTRRTSTRPCSIPVPSRQTNNSGPMR